MKIIDEIKEKFNRGEKLADSIKKTKQKYMLISMLAIMLVLLTFFGTLLIGVYAAIQYNAEKNLTMVEEMRGFIHITSEVGSPDSDPVSFGDGARAQYMYVRISNNGTHPTLITSNMTDSFSSNDILNIANTIIDLNDDHGSYQNFIFRVTKNDLNTVVSIIDLSNDYSMLSSVTLMSVVVIAASLVVVTILTHFLSTWAIKPVKDSLDNQRRFISDASHELKTPLSVITSNADVLETEIGENKWLNNIKSQSVVMNRLIYDLLDLAKLDETGAQMEKKEFNLSQALLNTTLEFESTAFESGKTLEENIPENIMYKGNEASIKQLASILIDNAIKHSDRNGKIRVTLTSSGNKRILQVFNTGAGFNEEEKTKIFERFYRSDLSRSRETGGYGLGLSIAKSIVEQHSGNISCKGEEGKWICFTAEL